MKFDFVLRFAAIIAFGGLTACSSGGGSSTPVSTCTLGSGPALTITGAITFDRVPLGNSGALDFSNTSIEPSKGVLVEAVCNSVISSVSTNDAGQYSLSVPSGTQGVIVRAKAKMLKTGTPFWDVEVLDDSQATNLIFAMDSSPVNMDMGNVVKNLHAASGHDGSSYTSTRVAAPFAIIDSINKSMQLVLGVNNNALFPALDIKWSPVSSEGTFYTSNEISVLGSLSDTDEFDEHVIAHEWGHYFQDAFSRDNSIGGRHSNGDILDIRVAFSEGFGNAFSAMVTGDPVYKDSQTLTLGFSIDVESNTCTNKGWYNECSVQSVLYDFFDDTNEINDVFSLGFDEIHEVMTSAMPLSSSLSSLFSFINPFKNLTAVNAADVDTLLNVQSIDSITDDFGTGVSNGIYDIVATRVDPPSKNIAPTPVTDIIPVYEISSFPISSVCSTGDNGDTNALGISRFIKFTAPLSGSFTFQATRINGISPADPDMFLYLDGEELIGFADQTFTLNEEEFTTNLIAGKTYILVVLEFAYADPSNPYDPTAAGAINETCFTITRTQN